VKGLAITYASNTANGTWQYTLDNGASWISFPVTSASHALLLPANSNLSRVRFQPSQDFNGTVKLGYYAWDQTQGSTGGTSDIHLAASRGGTTAFSMAYRPSSLIISPVNDAPVMSTATPPALSTINEDNRSSWGTTIASVAAGITDVDAGAVKGLAITYASNTANGTWQYTLDNGSTWINFPPTSSSHALLLPANGNLSRVRFQPNQDFNGTVKLSYYAWDQTQGTAGGTVDVHLASSHGGTKAFSTAYRASSLTISPRNDAPTIWGISGTVGYVRDNPPILLAAGAGVSDIDSPDFAAGRLTVHINEASTANRLALSAGFTVDADKNVLQGTSVIGKLNSSGWGTSDLVVTFNSSVTNLVARDLIRSITFKTVGGTAGSRSVNFTITDGDGGVSGVRTKVVNVT
jgi:hypothetical protein